MGRVTEWVRELGTQLWAQGLSAPRILGHSDWGQEDGSHVRIWPR